MMSSGDAEDYRVKLERSRLAAVQERAAGYSLVKSMAAKLDAAKATLATCETALTSTEECLKLREMELQGANAQLQVGIQQHREVSVGATVVFPGLA
jgi:hypothetical protein